MFFLSVITDSPSPFSWDELEKQLNRLAIKDLRFFFGFIGSDDTVLRVLLSPDSVEFAAGPIGELEEAVAVAVPDWRFFALAVLGVIDGA